MPSPKAVLRDIHDFGLNPKKAHSAIKRTGRLHGITSGKVKKEPMPIEAMSVEPVAPLLESVKKAESIVEIEEVKAPEAPVTEVIAKEPHIKRKKKDKPEKPPMV